MPETGVIIIRRERSMRFFLRGFKINVDGSAHGGVRNGQTRRLVVPAGRHDVRVTLDWQGSQPMPVDVPPNGTVTLVCEPTRNPLAAAHAAQRDYDSVVLRRE